MNEKDTLAEQMAAAAETPVEEARPSEVIATPKAKPQVEDEVFVQTEEDRGA